MYFRGDCVPHFLAINRRSFGSVETAESNGHNIRQCLFLLNLLLRGLRARFTDCRKYREDLPAWDFDVSDCLAALAVFADAPDRKALMITADDFEEGPAGRRDRMRPGIDCPMVVGRESASLKERPQIIVDRERIILPQADFWTGRPTSAPRPVRGSRPNRLLGPGPNRGFQTRP